MKMQKKLLQIQTNFLEEDQPSQPIVTTSKINYEQKLQAATLFQKSLSMILARNFIECWKELKDYQQVQIKVPKNNKVGKRRIQKNSQYFRQQRYQSMDVQNPKNIKPRSQSQAFRYLKTQRSSDIHEQEYRIKRNKSTRVINQQIQNSRASILKQIVQKLKNVRKTNQEMQQHQNNLQVLNRIGHLQKLIKGIKNENENKSQIHIYKTNENHNYSHSYNKNYNKNQQVTPQYKQQIQYQQQQDELVKQFIQQIQIIRKQVTQIKANNQLILKAQLERSQVSQNSNRQRNNQIQQNSNNSKGMVSQGSQTIQPVEIIVQKQPTLAEIQEKHKKLMEEVSILSKTVAGTHGNNGSYLGVSGVQSQKSDKYLVSNQIHKYNGSNTTNGFQPTKTSPLTQVLPTTTFSQIPKTNNFANLYTPPPITTIPTSIPPPITSNPTFSFQQQPPSNISFSNPISQPALKFQPQPQPQPTMSISRPFQYPKYDQIKTTTTFDSRNNISFNSNSQIGRTFQPTFTISNPNLNTNINPNFNNNINNNNSRSHLRNPSIHVYQQTRKNVIQYTNYCSACGRNCGCPRVNGNFKFMHTQ